MPSKATNSLFHEKTLRSAVQSFPFSSNLDEQQQKIIQWIVPLEKGVLDEIKEVSLHGQFLADVFQHVLGYRTVIQGSGQAWEIHAEQTISDGGGTADGALGFFTATEGKKGKAKLHGRVVAPIELKGAKNDLDRPAPGRNESAVDQGWRYANYTQDCKWVIVSNYREIRLYHTSKTPAYCEAFYLAELGDLETFKRFYFILCRQNFLPSLDASKLRSRVDMLLAESNEAENTITKELYQEYKNVRVNLTSHFRASAPEDILNRDEVLIEKAQKVLDRILFIAFCEDRRLLPEKTIRKAYEHKDIYNPQTIWDNYKAVFRWVNAGSNDPPIPGYNGGLFKHDSLLDEQLQVTDLLCAQLKELARFDFETEVSVNILGHIFEQSITDLEELRALTAGQVFDQKKGKRKTQAVYYTPAFVTQYIVDIALGGYLKRQEQALTESLQLEHIPKQATRQLREVEIQFWEGYRDVLLNTRVIDPACGSGAFLIAAFDYLNREYERVNEALAALAFASKTKGKGTGEILGQRSLFDLNKTLLNKNLYGVDLSPESVEITKLSLWLKTAEQGRTLTYLDDNIKVGNSIVADTSLDPRGFNWVAEFPHAFADGGFDVVIGNPPYVRQELLSLIKPYLQLHYETYDGVADLYTYFYEKGLKILKPGGVLSYIVTNKWFKAGYGEPLRRFFAQNSMFEQILDFGHAPIFEDADVFPCIVSVRSPTTQKAPEHLTTSADSTVRVCAVPREKLAGINLPQYVQQEGYDVPWSRFSADAWSLEAPAVDELMQKIKSVGVSLKDFVDVKPCYGLKTGLNEAFLIDNYTRNCLVMADPNCDNIIKPYLRGQDIKRWNPEWQSLWMILLKSGGDCNWEWNNAGDSAEEIFSQKFPSIYGHLKKFEQRLRKREDQGRYWWELRPCAYYESFEKPKIIHTDIAWRPQFAFTKEPIYLSNTAYMWATTDLYALAVVNSPLLWAYMWRNATHGKDEALRLIYSFVETIPIVQPTDILREQIENKVTSLLEITKVQQEASRVVLDWLQVEQAIARLGQRLDDFASLDCEQFVQEVKNRKPKDTGLSPRALKELRDIYNDYVPQIRNHRAEALSLETRLSVLVNQAYGLSPEEIDLMWKTAPPRMPISKPTRSI